MLVKEISLYYDARSKKHKKVLYMFRAVLCSSSGGQIVCMQHMVSSLFMSGCGGRTVHRLRECTVDHHDHS